MKHYDFECPHCVEHTVVDPGAMELLLDDGCIFCGREISRDAFKPHA